MGAPPATDRRPSPPDSGVSGQGKPAFDPVLMGRRESHLEIPPYLHGTGQISSSCRDAAIPRVK
eukprot:720049-Pelagomonas_calceolata.AAC.3